MKFLELYLKAYGPFTEKRINFSVDEPHLNVIYGLNESGKSSSLRAIRELLYGIPMRSTDNFIHDHSRMRVGGRLLHSTKKELVFLRKKGTKNTLCSYDDSFTLNDNELDLFIKGVPEDLFTRFFGIDHAALIKGGQQLLENNGEVGQSLFAAGLGSVNLRIVLSKLEEESGSLFKGSGSKPRINMAIAAYKDLKSRIKNEALKGRDWKELDTALSEAEKEFHSVSEELSKQRLEHARLERIKAALPVFARRRELIIKIQELGEVVPLSERFESRLLAAQNKRKKSEEIRISAQGDLSKLAEEMKELRLDAEFLAHRETVNLFRERMGGYKNALKDLPHCEGERDRLNRETSAELFVFRPDLTVDRLNDLIAPRERRRQIQDLVNRHSAFQEKVQNTAKALRIGQEKQTLAQTKLVALPQARDSNELRRALKAATSLGNIDGQINKLTLHLRQADEECQSGLSSLGLWSGTLEELARLAVPSMETIERFQVDFDKLIKGRDKIDEMKQSAGKRIREIDAQLLTLQKSGTVPTEEDLQDNRNHRDVGWHLVRRRWIEGENIDNEITKFTSSEKLADVYERSVLTADETSDRLRRETNRVIAQAELIGKREEALKDEAQTIISIAEIDSEEDAFLEHWQSAWKGANIKPNLPREMLPWLRRQQALKESIGRARGERNELLSIVNSRSACRMGLIDAMRRISESVDIAGEEISAVVVHAEQVLAFIEAEENQRKMLLATIESAEISVQEACQAEKNTQSENQVWLGEWHIAIEGLALQEDAHPVSALDRLDTITRLFEKSREIELFNDRIDEMGKYIFDFEREIKAFIQQHALDLIGLPIEQIIGRLDIRLSEIDKQETQRNQLNRRIDELEKQAKRAACDEKSAEEELKRLRDEAHCFNDAGLDPALKRWKEHQAKAAQLVEAEKQLTEIGFSVENIESEIEGINRDSLPGQLKTIEETIGELDLKRTAYMEKRAAARTKLDFMDGSGQVVQMAEESQAILSSIRHDVERFIRFRLAHSILVSEIELYRKEHQTPLLTEASLFFKELTLGYFIGLQAQYDDDDKPQLVGVRKDDFKVPVTGMSSGTCDQLYLALRLASLNQYIEQAEPMPFIIDDILVNFDDERTQATLKVLAELSKKTQILLFTHHRQIKEQAMALGKGAEIIEL